MIGRDGLLNLNLSGVFFCWSSNLLTGYPFEHLASGPLGRRSMINFAIA